MPDPELGVVAKVEQAYADLDMSPIPLVLGRTLSKQNVTLVKEYPSPGSKKLDESGRPLALQYPGQRPETSFSIVNDQVNACLVSSENGAHFYINNLAEDGDELVYDLNDFLRSKEAMPIEERFPVIAFGSNANPGQLAQKFKKFEGTDRDIVPTMTASLRGVVPVYAARIGINGYVFTDLFPASQAIESQVHINFLSKSQLQAMDETEKAYSLCRIPDVSLQTLEAGGYKTSAYLYVGKEHSQGANILVDAAGRPIRLAEISARGGDLDEQFAVMSQAEVQKYIYEIAAGRIAEGLHLDKPPVDEVDLIKLIINRQQDARLAKLKDHIKLYEPNQPLGRVVGRQIQQAIASTGQTAIASGMRQRIAKDSQDIPLENARNFGELNNLPPLAG